MGYCEDHNILVVCAKDNVERKSTKHRSTEIGIENLKSVGCNRDLID